MKDEKQVQKKLAQVRNLHLKKKIKNEYRCPENCQFNYLHEGDQGEVRLCLYGANNPEEWPGSICSTKENAMDCPFFEPVNTKEDLEEEFNQDTSNPEIVAHKYPDVAALRWVSGTMGERWQPSAYRKFICFVQLWAYAILARIGVFG